LFEISDNSEAKAYATYSRIAANPKVTAKFGNSSEKAWKCNNFGRCAEPSHL